MCEKSTPMFLSKWNQFGVAAALCLWLVMSVGAQQPTPNPANVIVIPPPTPSDPVERILSSPLVLTPAAPSGFFNAAAPPNFLQAGDTAIVTAGNLNVRTQPNTGNEALVLTQLQRGHDVTVLSFSPDLQWVFVDTRGPQFLQGWVNALYIEKQGDFQPFAPSLPDAAATGFVLRAQYTVNIRQGASIFSPRVGILPQNAEAEIIGRKSTYNWWKIRAGDTVGWVSASFVYVEPSAYYENVPVVTD